jgi:hydroxymethylpyrimidine pyrophosphatase-like HAD family hydrolase
MEMLAWAGHGVAMGQAPWDVQDVADEVADSVDDDGVAHLLNGYFA